MFMMRPYGSSSSTAGGTPVRAAPCLLIVTVPSGLITWTPPVSMPDVVAYIGADDDGIEAGFGTTGAATCWPIGRCKEKLLYDCGL